MFCLFLSDRSPSRYPALAAVLLGLLAFVSPAIARADSFLSFSDVERLIAQAHTVTISAYTLSSRSYILQDLDAAAARGATVDLILSSEGFGYAESQNRDILNGGHRFHVALSRGPLHLKMLVADGSTVVLTDRNFARDAVFLLLPARYALTVERAAMGDPHSNGALTMTKGTSLVAEAALIDGAKHTVALSTESFSDGNPVAAALVRAVRRHVRLQVTMNQAELGTGGAQLLDVLQRAGATILSSTADEKLAVIDSRTAWTGSANSTDSLSDQIEFGYSSSLPAFVAAITARLASGR